MSIKYYTLLALVFASLTACNSNSPKNDPKPDSNEVVSRSKSATLLAYIDSLAQVSFAQYDQQGVLLVNQSFKNSLPIRIYDGVDQVADTNLVVSINEPLDSIKSIVVSLPQSFTDSLTISDFIKHFGKLREVPKPIAPPKQPLPKYIDLSEKAYLRLFFNNRTPIDSAPIRSVEIYKHQ